MNKTLTTVCDTGVIRNFWSNMTSEGLCYSLEYKDKETSRRVRINFDNAAAVRSLISIMQGQLERYGE